jgi:hypothetical protein
MLGDLIYHGTTENNTIGSRDDYWSYLWKRKREREREREPSTAAIPLSFNLSIVNEVFRDFACMDGETHLFALCTLLDHSPLYLTLLLACFLPFFSYSSN